MLPRSPGLRLVVPLLLGACALAWLGVAPRAQHALPANHAITLEGGRRTWHPLTLTLATGVHAHESVHAPGANPFLDFRLVVTFTHVATGTSHAVPGFFAADGAAADTSAVAGNRWRARFTPERAGAWRWSVAFRRGAGIALSAAPGITADPAVDGAFGLFQVGPADPAAPGFLAKGRLEYAGERYFRFAETGEPYLKSGAGAPENFLAYFEFDGTTGDLDSLCLQPPEHPERLHRYAAHAADFVPDAVGLRHLWAGGKGQNILGAIDYLASVGVNALYFVTNTYKADGDDLWPWVTPQDKLHFDVSKLEQWERVLSHLIQRGLQLQIVLEENENDQLSVPGGGLGYGLTSERRLYYRELVARFAHHPAVFWVIGDESNYYDDYPVMESLALELRALDPYDNPIAFHSKHPCHGGGCPQEYPSLVGQYSPYFAFPAFEATAYQTVPGAYNSGTLQLIAAQVGMRPWAHFGDEQSLNAIPTNLDVNRTRALWGNLMAGGAGVAWYSGNQASSQYPPGVDLCDYYDVAVEDMRVLEDYFLQTKYAVDIFQAELPFTEMVGANELATPAGPQDYVLHRPADAKLGIPAVYAVYRGAGTSASLALGAGLHTVDWYDPRTGAGPTPGAPLAGPGAPLLLPPGGGLDWLAIVRQQ